MDPCSFAIGSPAIPLSKSPTSPAWQCSSRDAYVSAEVVFDFKWRQRRLERGPWDYWTVASLNNLVITKIKLQRFTEAENLCREALALRTDKLASHDPSYLCVRCNLCACLFLSDQRDEAENLFDDLRYLTDSIRLDPVKGFFEVLALVRLTHSDCLVLRASNDGVEDLIKVDDYATQLECGVRRHAQTPLKRTQKLIRYWETFIGAEANELGKGPIFRNGIGSFGRKVVENNVGKKSSKDTMIKGTAQIQQESLRPKNKSPSLQKAFSISQPMAVPQFDFNLPQAAEFASPQHHIANVTDVEAREQSTRSQYGAGTTMKAAGNDLTTPAIIHDVEHFSKHSESPNPLMCLTHRTNGSGFTASTDRSSQRGSVKPRNTLDVVAWAGERTENRVVERAQALLDSGAAADCISEAFCKDLKAAMDQSSTGTYMAVDGSPIQVSGHAWVSIKWDRPPFGASARAKIKFCVIKDLQVDMLIGAKTIEHQNMRSCAMLAPILLAARSKKTKAEESHTYQQQKAAGIVEAAEEAAQRKTERASLCHVSEEHSSMVGGSDTSPSRASTQSTTDRTYSTSSASQQGRAT